MKTKIALLCLLVPAVLWATPASICNASRFFHSVTLTDELPQFREESDATSWVSPVNDGSLIISIYSENRKKYGGTLYRYKPQSKELIRIAKFDSTNGSWPNGVLCHSSKDNEMYGVTYAGGNFNQGTIFRLDLTSNTISTVFHFDNRGARHPNYGLIPIGNDEYFGVCDTTSEEIPADPYNSFRCSGTGYIFNAKTGSVSLFSTGSEYGRVNGLPAHINADEILLLFNNRQGYHIMEYSVKRKKVVSVIEADLDLHPISGFVKGRDSCFYFMVYYTEAKSYTHPFICYNAGTNQYSEVAKGSKYTTMYSGDFTIDSQGNLFGFFKMGIDLGNGLLFKLNPLENKVETFVDWQGKYGSGKKAAEPDFVPGYDFLSNSVIMPDGYLYAVSWMNGLVRVDLNTRKVEAVVSYRE